MVPVIAAIIEKRHTMPVNTTIAEIPIISAEVSLEH
jgi:hypothetical protein